MHIILMKRKKVLFTSSLRLNDIYHDFSCFIRILIIIYLVFIYEHRYMIKTQERIKQSTASQINFLHVLLKI